MAEFLQAGYPSCHPTNSIKTPKDESVPDLGQHAAKIWQKHCDAFIGIIGCLALQFQGSSEMFLTWKQYAATVLSW